MLTFLFSDKLDGFIRRKRSHSLEYNEEKIVRETEELSLKEYLNRKVDELNKEGKPMKKRVSDTLITH